MSFFERLRIGRRGTAYTAKQRLQSVLIHDRSGISPGQLEALKVEMIDTLSRHVEIDRSSVQLSLTRERDRQRLLADIPLASRRSRRRTT